MISASPAPERLAPERPAPEIWQVLACWQGRHARIGTIVRYGPGASVWRIIRVGSLWQWRTRYGTTRRTALVRRAIPYRWFTCQREHNITIYAPVVCDCDDDGARKEIL